VSGAPIISLTTDFGTRDWFVGTVKGVIATINPQARVVDVSHEIPPGDIRAGAFALASSYAFFPKGTIHLAVVDPGVGSSRRAVAVRTENFWFVGPDNGVLSWATAREKIKSVHLLENPRFFLHPMSHTFHGRDLFSPVVAHLSKGVSVQRFGPRAANLVTIPWPTARRTRGGFTGEIVYVDRFGNCITNLRAQDFADTHAKAVVVRAGRKCRCCLQPYYQAIPKGRPAAVIGSSGFIEIAVNGGNAAQQFRLRSGHSVNATFVTRSRSS